MMLAAWPDGTWSVLYTQYKCSLPHALDCIDASGDPNIASIFISTTEGGEVYVDFPEGSECELPLVHWGDLVPLQLRPPYDALWGEWQDFCDEHDDNDQRSNEQEESDAEETSRG
jgi:hypothetical protein